MLKKVVSGFQTGADIAGIKAAVDSGLNTGGYMPKGYLTENGSHPEYKDKYNAQMISSTNYLERTAKNVFMSDGTVIFDYAISSGSKNTKRFCINYNKPYLYLTSNEIQNFDLVCERIKSFILENNIKVLNIAGNRESKTPGIEKRVYKILINVFEQLNK